MSGFLERLWYYPISDLSDEPSAEFVELTKKRNHYYDLLESTLDPRQISLLTSLLDAESEMKKEENKAAFIRGAKTVGGILLELSPSESSRRAAEIITEDKDGTR